MEEVGVESLFLEELGDFLSVFAGGAVDDGSARLLAGEVGSDYVVYIGEFLLGVGLDHDKFQVGAVGPPSRPVSSTRSSWRKYSIISAFTSGLAVAVRQSIGGGGLSPEVCLMNLPT